MVQVQTQVGMFQSTCKEMLLFETIEPGEATWAAACVWNGTCWMGTHSLPWISVRNLSSVCNSLLKGNFSPQTYKHYCVLLMSQPLNTIHSFSSIQYYDSMIIIWFWDNLNTMMSPMEDITEWRDLMSQSTYISTWYVGA